MPTISATTRGTSGSTNSICAISGGNDVAVPKPAPNKTTPSSNRGTFVPAAPIKTIEPASCAAYQAQATSRLSAFNGMAQPRSERPTMAMAVTNAIARPACCAPRAGTSREKRCAVKPICANNPRAMPVEKFLGLVSAITMRLSLRPARTTWRIRSCARRRYDRCRPIRARSVVAVPGASAIGDAISEPCTARLEPDARDARARCATCGHSDERRPGNVTLMAEAFAAPWRVKLYETRNRQMTSNGIFAEIAALAGILPALGCSTP